jgi:hypothetical protein
MCEVHEIVVRATCIAGVGVVSQAPKTLGDDGASCDPQPGETIEPQAVILCANR